MEFLLVCAGISSPDKKAISLFALECIEDMLDDTQNQPTGKRFIQRIPKILEVLVEYSTSHPAFKIFDLISEILDKYSIPLVEKINEGISVLVEKLIVRAELEYKMIKDNTKSSLVLHKIWHVLITIARIEGFVVKYQDAIESLLIPQIKHLEEDDKFMLDDDIIKMQSITMKGTKKVSELQWKLLLLYPTILKKSQGIISCMLDSLNYYIVFGQDKINQDPELINVLIEMALYALNPGPEDDLSDLNYTEPALLLQLIIQYLNPISDDQLKKIFAAIIEKYAAATTSYLKVRLAGVLLSSFIMDYPRTEKILIELEILISGLEAIAGDLMIYKNHPYDRKLFVMGLCNLMIQENMSTAAASKIDKLFESIVTVLTFTRFVEYREKKKKDDENREDDSMRMLLNSDILYNLINNLKINEKPKNKPYEDEDLDDEDDYEDDSDFDEDGSDDDYDFSEEREANNLAEKLVTYLKKKDEFEIFKEIFIKMKTANFEAVKQLCEGLPEMKKGFLKEVINSSRVDTLDGRNEARKIVKVKTKAT